MSPFRLAAAALTLIAAGWLIHRELNRAPEFCECCFRPVNIVSEVLAPDRVRAGTDRVRLLGCGTDTLTSEQRQALQEHLEIWIEDIDEVVVLINTRDLPTQTETDGATPAWLMDSKTKTILNVELARQGLVRVKEEPYRHLFFISPMKAAAEEAKQARRGIWADGS